MLTGRNNKPDSVESKVKQPEISPARDGILYAFVLKVEHVRSVVDDYTVKLAPGSQDLDWVSPWRVRVDEICGKEAAGT